MRVHDMQLGNEIKMKGDRSFLEIEITTERINTTWHWQLYI